MGEVSSEVRTFGTGATRSGDADKFDYDGFLSPLALERFARYMHENRKQVDGSLRDSDNWQKGIPQDSYRKSMWRHFFDVWKKHRRGENVETDLCALLFNVQGLLHEVVKPKPFEELLRPCSLCTTCGPDNTPMMVMPGAKCKCCGAKA